ncbi:MAG: hypothetical protein ACK56I_09810, partial [bacterium]
MEWVSVMAEMVFPGRSASFGGQSQKLARLVAHAEETLEHRRGPTPEGGVPTCGGRQEVVHLPQAVLAVPTGVRRGLGLGDALAKHGHGGVEFPTFALVE